MVDDRRTRANGRASREAIVAAAADLFAHRGYRGTRLVDVADSVGITKPGLAYHFATKEDLLREVVSQRELVMNESWVRMVDPGGSFAARMVRMAELLGAANAREPVLQQLLSTLVAEAIEPEHPLHQHYVDRYRRVRGSIADVVRAAQAAGECRADLDADVFALQAVAMMDGISQQWLLDPEAIDIEQALSTWGKGLEDELRPS